MRRVVVMAGGHAAGKTTLCKKLREVVPESQLNVVFGDLDPLYKNSIENKRQAVEDLLKTEKRHIIFEGARAPSGVYDVFLKNCTRDNLVFFMVIMSGDRLLSTIKHRRASNGQEFTEKQKEYWTPQKCRYESKDRYINSMIKLGKEYPDLTRNVELKVVKHSDLLLDFSALDKEFPTLVNWFMEPI